MSVLEHSNPADRKNATPVAQNDVNEALGKLTQVIMGLPAWIQAIKDHHSALIQAIKGQLTRLVGAVSDSKAPVKPVAEMVQDEESSGALSNSQGTTTDISTELPADISLHSR